MICEVQGLLGDGMSQANLFALVPPLQVARKQICQNCYYSGHRDTDHGLLLYRGDDDVITT